MVLVSEVSRRYSEPIGFRKAYPKFLNFFLKKIGRSKPLRNTDVNQQSIRTNKPMGNS